MPGPIRASGVAAERVEWLWRERIPRGMISVIAGRPDQGKGLFVAHLAAEVSAAGGKVLYSAAEDSHGLMTRPRLEAAGADLDNVLLWRFALPLNGPELMEICEDCRDPDDDDYDPAGLPVPIDLIVMDPFAAHLSGGVSRFGDNVRTILKPLTELVERTRAACVIVEHALKNVPKSGHPLDAIGGTSSGLPAASRAAFVFGSDPEDEDRRVLAPAKFNIGPKPKAFAFEIDVEDIDVVGDVPLLVPDGELMAFDPMKLFQTKLTPGKNGRPADKRASACEWLTTYLADAGQPVKSGTIGEDAKQYGMSAKTLRRAADDMGIVKHPKGGGRNCTWDLPDEVKDLMGIPLADAPADDETTPGEISLEDGLAALLGGDDETTEEDEA